MPSDAKRLAAIDERIGERLRTRGVSYDPWVDLGRRTGVDMQWHSGQVSRWERPLGVTDFENVSITLLNQTNEMRLRETLTHELIHLERGPRLKSRPESTEEAFVNSLAARRLIDPVLFDLLIERREVTGNPIRENSETWRILRVTKHFFSIYGAWRSRVKPATAVAAWEQFNSRDGWPAWPAPWMAEHRHKHPAIDSVIRMAAQQ